MWKDTHIMYSITALLSLKTCQHSPPLFPLTAGEPKPPPEAPNSLARIANAHIVVYLKSEPVSVCLVSTEQYLDG